MDLRERAMARLEKGESVRQVAAALDFTPSLVRASCDFSGWFQLVSELGWRQAAEARMWSVLVVIGPPFFDAGACVAHGQEPGGIEAFLAQPAVEGLYVCVVGGFSGPREVELDLVEVSPLIE